MRQVRAAEDRVKKIIRDKTVQYREKDPKVPWEVDVEWKKKHPCPGDRQRARENKVIGSIQAEADEILHNARMGFLTAEELDKQISKL